MTNKHLNSFSYRGDYYYEEDGKFFKILYGTKRISVKKRDFYRLKEKADGHI